MIDFFGCAFPSFLLVSIKNTLCLKKPLQPLASLAPAFLGLIICAAAECLAVFVAVKDTAFVFQNAHSCLCRPSLVSGF